MLQRPSLRFLLLSVLFLLWTGCSQPPEIQYKTKYVPIPTTIRVNPKPAEGVEGTFSSLKAGLEKGERLLVASGDYKESLTIPAGKTVWILADKDAKVRIVPGKGKSAFVLEEGAKLILQGVEIEDASRAVEVKKGARLEVRDSKFSNIVAQAIYATDATVVVRNCSFQNITKANAADFKKYGTSQGIRVKNGSLTVEDSTFDKTADRGVGVEGEANATILRSKFTTSGFSVSAVGVLGGVALLEELEFDGWKEGLFVKAAKVTARSLTIKNCSGNGVLVSGEGFLTLLKSSISAPKQSGISFFQATGNLRENTITNAGEYGIFISQTPNDSSVIIAKNTITDCKNGGIQLLNLKNAVISGNAISGSKVGVSKDDGNGIGCLDTRNVDIFDNNVSKNEGSGIYLERSTASLGNNKVSDNKDPGILVQNAPAASTIELVGNELDNNTVAGIFVLKSNVVLRKNRISNTVYSKADQSGTGVVLFESKAILDEERYESNSQHGLMIIRSSQASVSNSSFVSNKQFGIFVECNSGQLSEGDPNTFQKNTSGNKNKCN
jgi:parallel beta-helix repeat protein